MNIHQPSVNQQSYRSTSVSMNYQFSGRRIPTVCNSKALVFADLLIGNTLKTKTELTGDLW